MKIGMILSLTVFAIFFISFASAEITINTNLDELYNIGDIVNFPIKIIAQNDISDFLSINLLCNGGETEIHKEYVYLESGNEKTVNSYIPLLFDGDKKTGECKIKSVLGETFKLSENFEITDLIIVEIKNEKTEFIPGEMINIKGEALKENGETFDGFLEIEIDGENSTAINDISIIKNSYFDYSLNLSENKKAGKYLVKVKAYQKNSEDEITNNGFITYLIQIKQVPKNLEIILENKEVEPGTNLKVKAILHDQSGENIEAMSTVKIKNSEGKLIEQAEISTNNFFELPIAKNEKASTWKIEFESSDFSSSYNFNIIEKADLKITLVNKTVIFTNIGNIPYSGVVPIKIGNTTIEKNLSLELGEEKKYILTAPNGEYDIEISNNEEKINSYGTILTGNAIDIESAGAGLLSLLRMSVIWIFIIAILGLVVIIIYKKGYEKTFFGYISKKRKGKAKEEEEVKPELINSKNKAQLSLSIKGPKQNASIVALKIKDVEDLNLINSKVKESLQEIVDFAENLKAATYENNENIIFIIAPSKTKTFKNEKIAIKIAQKSKEVLVKHNKISKVKMNLGISLNYGTIITKQEKTLKFMSMGTLMGQAKKIAKISKGRILLSKKINDKLSDFFKTEKQEQEGVEFYIITDVKNSEENKKFIDSFVKRLNEEKKTKKK